MNKKEYASPDVSFIRISTGDILAASPLHPVDPQTPTRAGDEGGDEFIF